MRYLSGRWVAAGVMACIIGAGGLSRAAEGGDGDGGMLKEWQISTEKTLALFKAAFLKCEIDNDGDVRIEDDSVITFVTLDTKRKLLKYFSLWRMKADVPLEKKLELVNKWNKELIFAKFFVAKPELMIAEYWVTYENGVSAYQVVASYRLFKKVVVGAVSDEDPDDIVGG